MSRSRVYPTNAARQAAYRKRKKRSIFFSRKCREWETPQDFFDQYNAEFGFELDVCANAGNAKCARFFTKEDDGLKQAWQGVVWMNPPYGGRELIPWLKKAYDSAQTGATVVCLIPASTGTAYWWEWVKGKAEKGEAEIRFVPGRLHFKNPKKNPNGEDPAGFDSAVVIYRPPIFHNTKSVTTLKLNLEDVVFTDHNAITGPVNPEV